MTKQDGNWNDSLHSEEDRLIVSLRAEIARLKEELDRSSEFGAHWICASAREALSLPKNSVCSRYLDAIETLRSQLSTARGLLEAWVAYCDGTPVKLVDNCTRTRAFLKAAEQEKEDG